MTCNFEQYPCDFNLLITTDFHFVRECLFTLSIIGVLAFIVKDFERNFFIIYRIR